MIATTDDAVLAASADAAREALVAEVGAEVVGEALELVPEGDGVGTWYFACTQRGYPGWRWAVTLAHAAGEASATVDEIVLLPGQSAIVAPAWVPYRDRIRPGDLSPGDILPTDEDDDRLVPTFLAGDAEESDEHDDGQVRAVAKELGLGRTRVLSVAGRALAADRWYAGDQGPDSPLAQQAHHQCWSCGFLVRLAGPLAEDFGVCANEFANDDARVVAYGHGCGAHSEAQLRKKQLPAPVPDPIVDTLTPQDLERF
ncbi:DUF3027 domain-containing protein [Nocardioides mangrovicus]|uniref:DUF3027 domain-containing protein n=1 Tax=Nocardioides mangrovicus TaxID=2478913 RepID=A0A3L8NWI7_9ACTN|nr:DUF3027 domain-containing protein [Nocardioides mangrovicus]RLV47515.1 DUF3027 domain-containing protein [Nocardioides mangrovicus]